MATINRTKEGTRNQKKGVSIAHAKLGIGDAGVTGDIAELAVIPEDALLVGAHLNVKVAFDPGTSLTFLFQVGGNTIIAAISVASTGVKTLVFTKRDSGVGGTLTATSTLVGAAPTVGEADLILEYVEYNKNTGAYTEYSAT